MSFSLSSPAFANAAEIPRRFTCEGDDVSPPLAWSNIPKGTKSLALIVEDPDAPDPAAPQRTWVHWLLYNIPASVAALAEDANRHGAPAGSLKGSNDWHKTEYGGPCPPIGRHRYFHRLFALDTVLADLHHPSKSQLERAMQGHVLQEAVLIGIYAKQRA